VGRLGHFDALDRAGLMMYGQMTAGSWIYIGTQGILQGTYETFASAAKLRFGGTLAGTITVTAGLGGMGGAQPLAIALAGGVALCVEVDPTRIARRLETRYLDEVAASLDDALARAEAAKAERRALSIGLLGNAAEVLPEMVRRGFTPDLVTDQTSAHDPRYGYVPVLTADEDAAVLRREDPDGYMARVRASMADHVRAILEMQRRGAVAFDYGNNLRAEARAAGVEDAFDYPGFVPAFIRESFCEGRGPFRWVALSGDPADIAATDRALLELFPDDERLQSWLRYAGERVAFQGLPARICWLGYRERDRAGCASTRWCATARSRRPIVIGRDHLDAGSVASPYRETEAMRDGSDAVSDWPLLNFALGRVGRRLGQLPPRRRGGHGVQPARRPGRRRRRQRRGRDAAAHVPPQRPRPGRGAPRRRRLPHGPARRRRARPRPPEPAGDAAMTGVPGTRPTGTFAGAPARSLDDDWTAETAVLGVPTDRAVGFRPGARWGPRALREASQRYVVPPEGFFDPARGRAVLAGLDLVDAGDVALDGWRPTRRAGAHHRRRPGAARARRPAGVPGGRPRHHPPAAAGLRRRRDLHVVQFDAHLDFSDRRGEERHSNSSPFRRAVEDLPNLAHITVVGLRGLRTDPEAHAQALARGHTLITAAEVEADLAAVADRLPVGRRVYVSLDVDALDPASCPAPAAPRSTACATATWRRSSPGWPRPTTSWARTWWSWRRRSTPAA
jgi:arginase family enzyme